MSRGPDEDDTVPSVVSHDEWLDEIKHVYDPFRIVSKNARAEAIRAINRKALRLRIHRTGRLFVSGRWWWVRVTVNGVRVNCRSPIGFLRPPHVPPYEDDRGPDHHGWMTFDDGSIEPQFTSDWAQEFYEDVVRLAVGVPVDWRHPQWIQCHRCEGTGFNPAWHWFDKEDPVSDRYESCSVCSGASGWFENEPDRDLVRRRNRAARRGHDLFGAKEEWWDSG